MSTRSTTHFVDNGYCAQRPSIIYRHSDGYPSGAGTDIKRFFAECAKLDDPRFYDPAYLAAKYVVFLARKFAGHYDWKNGGKWVPAENPLDFLSVGVVHEDPTDIEYRYVVNCDQYDGRGYPELKCFKILYGEDKLITGPEQVIPEPEE